MVIIGPIQLYLIIAALAVLVAVVGIIFAQTLKMGFKYGIDYEKSQYRRYDDFKRRKKVSQYYRNEMRDAGSVRVHKPVH